MLNPVAVAFHDWTYPPGTTRSIRSGQKYIMTAGNQPRIARLQAFYDGLRLIFQRSPDACCCGPMPAQKQLLLGRTLHAALPSRAHMKFVTAQSLISRSAQPPGEIAFRVQELRIPVYLTSQANSFPQRGSFFPHLTVPFHWKLHSDKNPLPCP